MYLLFWSVMQPELRAAASYVLRSCYIVDMFFFFFFFFKQKTAYEIGTGDWSSDVCSSDLTMLWAARWHMPCWPFIQRLFCRTKKSSDPKYSV